MKRLFPLKPHVKKNSVEDRHHQSQPQLSGVPGWILLTHDQQNKPIALFADTHENVEPLRLIMNELMFSDTVLRAIKLSPTVFVVCDIRLLNGVNIFEKYAFSHRIQLLGDLLEDLFYSPELVALCLPSEAPFGTIVRGMEYYDDQPGTLGVFIPTKE